MNKLALNAERVKPYFSVLYCSMYNNSWWRLSNMSKVSKLTVAKKIQSSTCIIIYGPNWSIFPAWAMRWSLIFLGFSFTDTCGIFSPCDVCKIILLGTFLAYHDVCCQTITVQSKVPKLKDLSGTYHASSSHSTIQGRAKNSFNLHFLSKLCLERDLPSVLPTKWNIFLCTLRHTCPWRVRKKYNEKLDKNICF